MVQPTPTPTASSSAAASTTSTTYAEYDSAHMQVSVLQHAVPGFETVTAIFGLLFATVIAVVLKRVR